MKGDLEKEILVSITFPIHNFHEYSAEALLSLLKQTYSPIEILFLDNSLRGLESSFDLSDKRIKYYKLPPEYGLSETLNFALDRANGKYLARMDYDDVAFPTRIADQVEFMENNPDIAISGTNIIVIGKSIDSNVSPGQEVKRKALHEDIVRNLLTNNAFFHPTVIFRLSEIRKYNLKYRTNFDSAEDLDLWCRASRVLTLANLDRALLQYRLHPNQYSRLDGASSNYLANRVRIRHAFWLMRTNRLDILLGAKISIKLFFKSFWLMYRKKGRHFSKFT